LVFAGKPDNILAIKPTFIDPKVKKMGKSGFQNNSFVKPMFTSLSEASEIFIKKEEKLNEQYMLPALIARDKFNIDMCKKSHVVSRLPFNPSLDTYLGRDDDLEWSDVYEGLVFF
jgi:hypothetical protein